MDTQKRYKVVPKEVSHEQATHVRQGIQEQTVVLSMQEEVNEETALRRELERMRMERDILKNALRVLAQP